MLDLADQVRVGRIRLEDDRCRLLIRIADNEIDLVAVQDRRRIPRQERQLRCFAVTEIVRVVDDVLLHLVEIGDRSRVLAVFLLELDE